MISEEPFVKNLNQRWRYAEIKGSFGQIGDDNVSGRWLYMDTWSYGGAFNQGLTGVNSRKAPTNGTTSHKWEPQYPLGSSHQIGHSA